MLVGNRIEKLINEQNKTKSEILDKIGLSKATLYNIINGVGSPSCENLEKVADYFGVSMDYFFDRNKGISNSGHYTINNNTITENLTMNEYQREIAHLNSLLEEKERIISEKERTIQILINK